MTSHTTYAAAAALVTLPRAATPKATTPPSTLAQEVQNAIHQANQPHTPQQGSHSIPQAIQQAVTEPFLDGFAPGENWADEELVDVPPEMMGPVAVPLDAQSVGVGSLAGAMGDVNMEDNEEEQGAGSPIDVCRRKLVEATRVRLMFSYALPTIMVSITNQLTTASTSLSLSFPTSEPSCDRTLLIPPDETFPRYLTASVTPLLLVRRLWLPTHTFLASTCRP